MTRKSFLLAMPVAIGLSMPALDVGIAQGMQDGMGPGMMQGGMMRRGGMGQGGMGQGGMGQGGMGQGGMGQGGMGQGGMGQGGMGQGGMGQGMMCPMMAGMMQGGMGEGMMGQGSTGFGMMRGGAGGMFGSRVTPMMNLSVDDVRSYLGMQLERLNNKRLKVGTVAADGGMINAEITTVDNSLVQRLKVNRHTGAIEYEN